MKVTVKDCRASGYCLKGVKEWCIKNHIDYRKLIREGVDTEELPLDDYYVKQIVTQLQADKERLNITDGD